MSTPVDIARIYLRDELTAATVTIRNTGGTTIASGNWVEPVWTGFDLSHSFQLDEAVELGVIKGLTYSLEKFTLTIPFIPTGSSDANARLAATIPPMGAHVTISGAPVIVAGSFTDVLNYDGATGAPWFYVSMSLSQADRERMTGTITLQRQGGITSYAAV